METMKTCLDHHWISKTLAAMPDRMEVMNIHSHHSILGLLFLYH